MAILKTERLLLRPPQMEDLEAFARLNADPRVMEYFLSPLTTEESRACLEASIEHIEKYGWGKWAVVLLETGEFIGRIGLEAVDFQASFAPNIELGYRLAFDHWGKGYASEGARAVLEYGFSHLALDEIVAFTSVPNVRSRAVMERLGMWHDAQNDFDHPKVPEGHRLRRHVLYRIGKSAFQEKHGFGGVLQ